MATKTVLLTGQNRAGQDSRHGCEIYILSQGNCQVNLISKKLLRQLPSQLCNQKISSMQLSSQLFFKPICQGNCEINCVTQIFVQGNCQVNYLF